MASWQDFIFGTPGNIQQVPAFTTQTQDTINKLLGMGLEKSNLAPVSFQPIAQEATRRFNQETIPGLLNRFSVNQGNSRGGSGLAAILGNEARNYNSGLNALQAQFELAQQGNQQRLASDLLRLGLTPTYQNIYTPPQPGLAHGAAPAVGQAIGSAAGSALGTFAGHAPFTAAGAGIGTTIGGIPGGLIGGALGGAVDLGTLLYNYIAGRRAQNAAAVPSQQPSMQLPSSANAIPAELLNKPLTLKDLLDFSGGGKK